jgi:hypothetical protein
VKSVRIFLAIARNPQKLFLVETAREANVDLAVVTELTRIAFEGFLKLVKSATVQVEKKDDNVRIERSMSVDTKLRLVP